MFSEQVDFAPLPEFHLQQCKVHWINQLHSTLMALQAAQDQSVEFQDYGGAACASMELSPAQDAVEHARMMLGQVESEIKRRGVEMSEAGSRRSSCSSVGGIGR